MTISSNSARVDLKIHNYSHSATLYYRNTEFAIVDQAISPSVLTMASGSGKGLWKMQRQATQSQLVSNEDADTGNTTMIYFLTW